MLNRRHLLTRAAAAAPLLGLARHVAALPAAADAAADYKALVCVFLFGGNDANHMVLPLDAAALADHRRARAAAGLAFEADALAALPAADGGAARFGLHPALAPLLPLWQRQRMALLFNTGALVEPLTRSAYLARGVRSNVPDNLFSHSDQQDFAQALVSPGGSAGGQTGWGFRAARRLEPTTPRGLLPTLVSFDGNQRFVQGGAGASLVLPSRGSFGIGGGGSAGDAAGSARLQAFRAMWADAASPIGRQAGERVASGLAAAGVVNPILTGTTSPLTGAAFAPDDAALKSDLAQQLQRVSRLLEARGAIGNRRQIFFVGMGGFDTHVNQARELQRLYGELAAALAAFHAATEALGIADRVTTFTLSDFARTLKANGSGGTDHGWGGHQIVLGGAVRGQRSYGTFPTLAAGGPDDAGNEGRWIPTTAHDQVAATLARWFGVDDAGLLEVAPNLGRFATADVGFMA